MIVEAEVVVLGESPEDEVDVGRAVEDEDEVASTGKFSPGLNCNEEFFAYSN